MTTVKLNDLMDLDDMLDEIDPPMFIGRCDHCGMVKPASVVERMQCGPNFGTDTFCHGWVLPIDDPPQEALMAAVKLGGTKAALAMVFDGCKACVTLHVYSRNHHRRCPEHLK